MTSAIQRLGRAGVLGLLVAVVLATAAGIAQADPWGTGTADTGAHPDVGPHTWCFGPTWPSGNQSANNAESNLANQTYAAPEYKATCKLDGTSQTDVKWGALDLDGSRGQTRCAVVADSGHCDRNNITIDFPEIDKGSWDDADEWKTTCHELGHSVGLTHGSIASSDYQDCMMSGAIPDTDVKWHHYNAHHKVHVNNWFQ